MDKLEIEMKKEKIPIYYIDEEKDLDLLVKHAANSTMEENLTIFLKYLAFNFALAGIDIYNQPIVKKIYYIEDELQSKERDIEDLTFLTKLKEAGSGKK